MVAESIVSCEGDLRVNQFDVSGNDSTRSVRFLTRIVQFVAQAMLLVFAVQTTEVSAQEAGDLIEVEIPDAAVTIRFHYCPRTPEPVITGHPGKPDQPPFKTTGFYLSEAEITRDQYAAVLGEEKLEEVGNRLEEFYTTRDNEKGFKVSSYNSSKDGAHPIFCITLREAAEFCVKLNSLGRIKKAGSDVLVLTARIPSQFEWQYACRGRVGPEAAESPHFSGWPKAIPDVEIELADGVGSQKLVEICRDRWKELLPGNREQFTGDQSQVVELVTLMKGVGGDDKTYQNRIMTQFLKQGIDFKQPDFSDMSGKRELRRANEGAFMNLWELRHMHTNVYEWTINCSSPEEIIADWDTLRSGNINSEAFLSLKGGAVGGASSSTQWQTFTIWDVREKETEDISPEKGKIAEKCNSSQCGIRVLLEFRPKPEWLVEIRRKATIDAVGPNTHTELLANRKLIIANTPNTTEAIGAGGQINYYRALAYMRAKDTDNAMKAFKEAEPVIGKNDDYFKFLSAVMEEDGK